MKKHIDWYFDFISPYSFICLHRLGGQVVTDGLVVEFGHPIDLYRARNVAGVVEENVLVRLD